jgi:CRISPR system Cascade subunit CasB
MNTQAVPAPSEQPPTGGPAFATRGTRLKECGEFADAVRRACQAPGTQQALRRALGKDPSEVPARTHAALMGPGLLPYGARGARRRAYYTVAALIAARPRSQRDTQEQDGTETVRPAADTAAADTTQATKDKPEAASPAQQTATAPASPETTGRVLPVNLGGSLARAIAREHDDATDSEREGIKANGAESRLHLLVRQESEGLHRMLPGVVRLIVGAGVPVDYGCLLNDLLRWERQREDVVVEWLESYYRTLRRAPKQAG